MVSCSRRADVENDLKLDSADLRATPFRPILRKFSLDELPQQSNVLGGDVGTVGNRHLVELELEMRPERNQELHRPLRPELTGLWQGEGRSLPRCRPSPGTRPPRRARRGTRRGIRSGRHLPCSGSVTRTDALENSARDRYDLGVLRPKEW